jgi:hypothetical protein
MLFLHLDVRGYLARWGYVRGQYFSAQFFLPLRDALNHEKGRDEPATRNSYSQLFEKVELSPIPLAAATRQRHEANGAQLLMPSVNLLVISRNGGIKKTMNMFVESRPFCGLKHDFSCRRWRYMENRMRMCVIRGESMSIKELIANTKRDALTDRVPVCSALGAVDHGLGY